jgi:hypothetical protein
VHTLLPPPHQELIAVAGDLNEVVLPWATAEGLLAPLTLSANILEATKDSLTLLRSVVPPSLLVDPVPGGIPGAVGGLSLGTVVG